jgi:hypothetical protein
MERAKETIQDAAPRGNAGSSPAPSLSKFAGNNRKKLSSPLIAPASPISSLKSIAGNCARKISSPGTALTSPISSLKSIAGNAKKKIFSYGIAPIAIALLIILAAIPSSSAYISWYLFRGLLPYDMAKPSFWTTEASSCKLIGMDHGWIVTCVAALAIGYSAAALARILSGPFGARLSAWSKDTLYNTAKSTIIVIFIIGAYAVSLIPAGSFYGAGLMQIESAINYADTVRNTLIMEFTSMTVVTAVLSTVGNITPYFRPNQMIGISFSLSPAFRPVFDALGILLSMMSVSVGEWFVHIWILCFIKSRVLSILLPAGVLMRSMGLTRSGDGLIALCVGLFFVYPFMLNVSSYATLLYLQAEYGHSAVIQASDGSDFSDFNTCFDHTKQFGTSGYCYFELIGSSFMSAISSSFDAHSGSGSIWDFFGKLTLGSAVQLLTGSLLVSTILGLMVIFVFGLFKATAFYVLIVSILMPLFNIFITFTAMKEIAAFLGTQLDFSAFEKIF